MSDRFMRYTDPGAPWLHIYPQPRQHGQAFIRGNAEALTALRDALTAAIESGQGEAGVFAHDGEGYAVTCQRVNIGGLLGPLPYTEEGWTEARDEFFRDQSKLQAKARACSRRAG